MPIVGSWVGVHHTYIVTGWVIGGWMVYAAVVLLLYLWWVRGLVYGFFCCIIFVLHFRCGGVSEFGLEFLFFQILN